MREAVQAQMPAALRKLFVTILVYCNSLEVRRLWNEFYQYMLEDYSTSTSSHSATRQLINDLELSLNDFGKGIKDFDLPGIEEFPNETADFNPLIHDERSIPISQEDLDGIKSLNSNQQHVFAVIMDAVTNNRSSIFFIDGPAGTGKTFLYRTLLAAIKTQGRIALVNALSRIASIMMAGGRTAHSRFKIPIPILPNSTCKISKQSDLADLLYKAAIIIWDEASMTHRHVFEAFDRTLQDLFLSDLPFGGKIVVLGGDFRQTLPIVPHGSQYQIANACVTYSSLWDHVHILHISENMCASTDPLYANMLLKVGDGNYPYINEGMIKISDEMIIPWEGEHSITQLIHSVFPNISDNAFNNDYIMQRALITPKNKDVHKLNDQVLKMFLGNEITYHSFDDAQDNDNQLFEVEFLNSISTSQLPPHKLTLKIGCLLIVLRNLDTKNVVCNGTRVFLRAVNENIMHAKIINGTFASQPVLLPRIPLRSYEQDIKMPFFLIRNQFLVRLSFALTINKAQGQTIPNVGIFLPNHVFNHGQLYVALSRSTHRDNTKILIKNASIAGLLH